MNIYGVDLGNAKLKADAALIFMNDMYLRVPDNADAYRVYCEDNELDPEADASKIEFVESYQNDSCCWEELEGLITDFINDRYHAKVFEYADFILGVYPTIPVNDEAKKFILTEEDIQNVLSKVITPLIEGELNISWHVICD